MVSGVTRGESGSQSEIRNPKSMLSDILIRYLHFLSLAVVFASLLGQHLLLLKGTCLMAKGIGIPLAKP
jgi:hypothetical protein